jgi:crotonobetainyl-CoA:carnitine CoA-transferase CaiB-like acyl-CoA transferase
MWLALAVATDAHWRALCDLLDNPAWARDPAYASHALRRAAQDEIDALLLPRFAEWERDALVDALLARGVPAAPVADPRAVASDPQLTARGFYEEFTHQTVGTHRAAVVPFRYASVESWLRSAAPTLGQHNREVLRELAGASGTEISDLEAAGVIGTRPVGL